MNPRAAARGRSDPRETSIEPERNAAATIGRRRVAFGGTGGCLLARTSFAERGLPEFSLATHDIQHVDAITVVPVEGAAGWLNDLAIAPATQFLWFRAAVRVSDQLLDVLKYALHQRACRGRVIERDVAADRV